MKRLAIIAPLLILLGACSVRINDDDPVVVVIATSTATSTPVDTSTPHDTERYLAGTAEMINRLTEDELKPLLRVVGTVHLNGGELSWRYDGNVALLVPYPTVVAWR